MPDLYYSDPDAVIKEASVEPEDLNEDDMTSLRERVRGYLVGVKGLMDAFIDRDFHEEFKTGTSPTFNYSAIPKAVHYVGLQAGANAVLSAKERNAHQWSDDEYRFFVRRDEVLTESVKFELGLLKHIPGPDATPEDGPSAGSGKYGFNMFRVRSPKEREEDIAAGRLR